MAANPEIHAKTAHDDPVIRPVDHFQGARESASPRERLEEVRRRSRRFRDDMLAGGQVVYYESFELVRVPYPTRYGLRNAFSLPTPMCHIVNRLFVIQFESPAGLKTMLVSPSDLEGNAETPFFKRLAEGMGPLSGVGTKLIAPMKQTVEQVLERIGLRPESVDYITYDHLHTQELRKWLGANGQPGYFPNARLLVMADEWANVHGLLPYERDWYCPRGCDGIDPAKIILLDSDVMLGEGVALVRTPGHTPGNHSIVAHTPEGLFVTSENGISPECYAPLHSTIAGVAKYARTVGVEVILNANTLQTGTDEQYISMVKEKTIAGPSQRNPDFPNMACSSELAGYYLFPGTAPGFGFGDLRFGTPRWT